jgi:hypothetical protein
MMEIQRTIKYDANRVKGHVKDIHGTKRDLVIMANDLSHIWEAMESFLRDYSPALE